MLYSICCDLRSLAVQCVLWSVFTCSLCYNLGSLAECVMICILQYVLWSVFSCCVCYDLRSLAVCVTIWIHLQYVLWSAFGSMCYDLYSFVVYVMICVHLQFVLRSTFTCSTLTHISTTMSTKSITIIIFCYFSWNQTFNCRVQRFSREKLSSRTRNVTPTNVTFNTFLPLITLLYFFCNFAYYIIIIS